MTRNAPHFIAARALCACAAAVCSSYAAAHVGLEWPAAMAGSGYKAVFRIGHGCGNSPTRQVVVDIPAGVQGARPMPKPGWTLQIDRAPLPQPAASHGRTRTEDVSRITWTAASAESMLDPAHYDEFALFATLPATPGRIHWPVHQVCKEGRHDWTQVPTAGQAASALESPAPALDILPAAGTGGHTH